MQSIRDTSADRRKHRGIVPAIRGEHGNAPIGRILEALRGNVSRDPRPPGICPSCYAAWHAKGQRNAPVTCKHQGCEAQRYRGRWLVRALA